MAEVVDHAQPAGQGQSAPDPHVADVRGVLRLAVGLFFRINIHSSSICTWVRGRLRMSAVLTTALCCPANASQCSMRFGGRPVRRATALRLLRSLRSARASSTVARASQSLEERMLIRAERVPARRPVVALLHVAKGLDVARSRDPLVGASLAVAPLPSEFHDASPPENDDTSDDLSQPTAYRYISSDFTAYGYSTGFPGPGDIGHAAASCHALSWP